MRKKISLLITVLIVSLLFAVPAVSVRAGGGQQPLLVDDAHLLDDGEREDLLAKLEEISSRQGCDVAVVTVDSMDGMSAQDFADNYYDNNGYGAGSTRDGIMLAIGMSERAWAMSTHGSAIGMFTDAGLSYIQDRFQPYLSDGDFAGAFSKFADLSDQYITQAKKGAPYDTGNMPKEPKGPIDRLIQLVVSLLAGLVPAGIVTGGMKSELKPVARKYSADNYVRAGSFHAQGDRRFIRKALSVTPRPKKSERTGGGSSTHTSSSGETHGGSSGHF